MNAFERSIAAAVLAQEFRGGAPTKWAIVRASQTLSALMDRGNGPEDINFPLTDDEREYARQIWDALDDPQEAR